MVKTIHPPFDASVIESVAAVLGDTANGLTGSQIGQRLGEAKVPDVDPDNTKWKRIYNALAAQQNHDQAGNCVIAFIGRAMKPVRYTDDPARFTYLQHGLNEVLVHAGLRINDKGEIARLKGGSAATLTEAQQRAGTIRSELRRRGTHPEVVRYCTDELLAKDNFHALLEAAKSIFDRVRNMTEVDQDGAELIDTTLTNKSGPRIAINAGTTVTDTDEQSGFANLIKGLYGMYRNPTAHDPRLNRAIEDFELLEALTTISMVHRRLDDASLPNAQ